MANWLPWQAWHYRRRIRQALPATIRDRLRLMLAQTSRRHAAALRDPLGLARFVVLDLETTGLHMFRDRLITIGAVAVQARTIRHDDHFERTVRQEHSSSVENILIHHIGGQAQQGGVDPTTALLDFLEFVQGSVLLAFRADFDATILRRELAEILGVRLRLRVLDLAAMLPALIPGTPHQSLDDWARWHGVRSSSRHHAVDDAYVGAALLLVVLERATRLGLASTRDLFGIERAHRWLGWRHFRA